MESIKNWWYGSNKQSSSESNKGDANKPSETYQQADINRQITDLKQQQGPITQETLRQATDMVNRTKAIYDECERRRMNVLNTGKDPADYSCEREFDAFKRAFDYQTLIESKVTKQQEQSK